MGAKAQQQTPEPVSDTGSVKTSHRSIHTRHPPASLGATVESMAAASCGRALPDGFFHVVSRGVFGAPDLPRRPATASASLERLARCAQPPRLGRATRTASWEPTTTSSPRRPGADSRPACSDLNGRHALALQPDATAGTAHVFGGALLGPRRSTTSSTSSTPALTSCSTLSRPGSATVPRSGRGRSAPSDSQRPEQSRPHRRSLFASMSNHIANSVSCSPAISSTATSTIVAGVISFPASRSTTSSAPSTSPATLISTPNT